MTVFLLWRTAATASRVHEVKDSPHELFLPQYTAPVQLHVKRQPNKNNHTNHYSSPSVLTPISHRSTVHFHSTLLFWNIKERDTQRNDWYHFNVLYCTLSCIKRQKKEYQRIKKRRKCPLKLLCVACLCDYSIFQIILMAEKLEKTQKRLITECEGVYSQFVNSTCESVSDEVNIL